MTQKEKPFNGFLKGAPTVKGRSVFQALIWEGSWRADEADDLFPKRLFASLDAAKTYFEKEWNAKNVQWEFDEQTKLHTAEFSTGSHLVIKEIPVQEE